MYDWQEPAGAGAGLPRGGAVRRKRDCRGKKAGPERGPAIGGVYKANCNRRESADLGGAKGGEWAVPGRGRGGAARSPLICGGGGLRYYCWRGFGAAGLRRAAVSRAW